MSGGFDDRFVITTHIQIFDISEIQTFPQKTILEANIGVYVGDGLYGTLFSSYIMEAKGLGDDKDQAIAAAVRKIRLARLKKLQGTGVGEADRAVAKVQGTAGRCHGMAQQPSTANGDKGTASYQQIQKMERTLEQSSISQVLYKYLDDKNELQLPEIVEENKNSENTDNPAGTYPSKLCLRQSSKTELFHSKRA